MLILSHVDVTMMTNVDIVQERVNKLISLENICELSDVFCI